MKLQNIPTYSTALFSYRNKKFVAEASDLAPRDRLFGQIYDDACDIGLALKSQVTGRVMTFCQVDTLTDIEGEIQVWICRLCPEDARKSHEFKNLEVHILND